MAEKVVITLRDAARSGGSEDPDDVWHLRLYVAGQTPKSLAAFANLKRFCAEHLQQYEIEVVDLLEDPQRARRDEVVAIPTLIRRLPSPIRRIIGDLSHSERILIGLELKPRPKPGRQ